MKLRPIRTIVGAAVVSTVLGFVGMTAPAVAAPQGSTQIVSTSSTGPTSMSVIVHSASMNKDIPLSVLKPKDTSKPRGVFYLLNGAGGGEDSANWFANTDIINFFAQKNVWVVVPEKGIYSYYTDWEKTDPKLGIYKWSTFLGEELPPVFNAKFKTSGKNILAGISTSATSVLNLAIEYPKLFSAVGAYSGCASTSTPEGQTYVRLVVEGRGGTKATNMWGPYNSAGWVDHDPVVNAAKLRGTRLYLSASTGLPGPYDSPNQFTSVDDYIDRVALGGGIEAATRICTQNLAQRLAQLRIPATVDFPPVGTHSWGYWQDELHKSWPVLSAGIMG